MTVFPDECTNATASRWNSAVYRLLVLLFLLTTWNCFRPDLPSQYQAVQLSGGTSGRISTAVLRDATHWDDVVARLGYEHLRRHNLRHTGLTWFADAGVQVHVLRAPRSLPARPSSPTDAGQGILVPNWSPKMIKRPLRITP